MRNIKNSFLRFKKYLKINQDLKRMKLRRMMNLSKC